MRMYAGWMILVLGLVAFCGIAAGQGQEGTVSTDALGMVTDATGPDGISGLSAALPTQATAEFRIFDYVEINTDRDAIPRGTLSGRQWGSLSPYNTRDATQTRLGRLRETLLGDSFTRPEFPENATWNSTSIRWTFPPNFVLNDSEYLSSDYHTTAQVPVNNPVTLTRSVNRSVFYSDGYQFNSYTVNFNEKSYEAYSVRIAYSTLSHTNSSILFPTFTTDLPLTYISNSSNFHPITQQYVSEIYFSFPNTSIQLRRPYHFNVTAAIRLRNNAGLGVKSYPRIYFSMDRQGPLQQGPRSATAIMPSALLPAHVTCATVTTNVSNVWLFRHNDQLKLAFNQTDILIRQGKIGVFRPSTHAFMLKNGSVNTTVNWGLSADLPVSGDWNGDGLWDVGVFRPSVHRFFLKNGTANTSVNWGVRTDLPVSGDWNGDGLYDAGVFRPSAQRFFLKNGSANTSVTWGVSTDLPVSGDWNGDGLSDVGVFRPSAQRFYLKNGTANTSVRWGISTDLPVSGDWNGDGLYDVGVFRPSIHRFYLKNGTANTSVSWGLNGDKPVSGKWS